MIMFGVLIGVFVLMLVAVMGMLLRMLLPKQGFLQSFREAFCRHDFQRAYEYTTNFMGYNFDRAVVKCSKCGKTQEL